MQSQENKTFHSKAWYCIIWRTNDQTIDFPQMLHVHEHTHTEDTSNRRPSPLRCVSDFALENWMRTEIKPNVSAAISQLRHFEQKAMFHISESAYTRTSCLDLRLLSFMNLFIEDKHRAIPDRRHCETSYEDSIYNWTQTQSGQWISADDDMRSHIRRESTCAASSWPHRCKPCSSIDLRTVIFF